MVALTSTYNQGCCCIIQHPQKTAMVMLEISFPVKITQQAAIWRNLNFSGSWPPWIWDQYFASFRRASEKDDLTSKHCRLRSDCSCICKCMSFKGQLKRVSTIMLLSYNEIFLPTVQDYYKNITHTKKKFIISMNSFKIWLNVAQSGM